MQKIKKNKKGSRVERFMTGIFFIIFLLSGLLGTVIEGNAQVSENSQEMSEIEKQKIIIELKSKIKELQKRISFLIQQKSKEAITKNFYNPEEVTDYKVVKKYALHNNERYVVLREFIKSNQKSFFVVNIETLETYILQNNDFVFIENDSLFENSLYEKVKKELRQKEGLQNTGIQNMSEYKDITGDEVFLTADFCPSRKESFEKDFFEDLIEKGHKNVAIAITGSWVEKHREDFLWLLQKNATGELNITWVNHSHNHEYDFDEHDLHKNFLLIDHTDIEEEILEVEKMLFSYNQKPSIYMRFPGLVSDDNLRREILDTYGLLFIGSDAWLAKGESPQSGSIILIHGNKNEPAGIVKAHSLIEEYDENSFIFSSLE